MISLFLWLLRPALMCVDGGSRKPLHIIAALIAYPLDLIICNTTWRVIAGPRQGSEKTISDTLERLCLEVQNPGHALFLAIAQSINRVSPTGRHILNA